MFSFAFFVLFLFLRYEDALVPTETNATIDADEPPPRIADDTNTAGMIFY